MGKSITKNISIQTISVVGQALMQIIYISVLSRLISPKDFGLAAIGMAIVSISRMLSEAGIGSIIVQRFKINKSFISTAFLVVILMYSVFGLIMYFIAPLIGKYNHAPELTMIIRFLIIPFFLFGLSSLPMSLLLRHKKYKKLLYIELISYFIGLIVISIILAYFEYGVWAILWGQTVFSLLTFFLSTILSKMNVNLKTIRKDSFKDIFHFGGGITLSRIFNYFTIQGDKFILGNMLSVTILGYFDRIYKIVLILSAQLGNIMDKISFPILSQMQNDEEKFKEAYYELFNIALQTGLLIVSILPFYSKEIINILLGEKWLHLHFILSILFVLPVFGLITRIGDVVLRSKAKVYQSAVIKFFTGTLTLTFLYLGVKYDLKGVAIAYVFAYMLRAFVLNVYVIVYLKISVRKLFGIFILIARLPLILAAVLLILNYFTQISNIYIVTLLKTFSTIMVFAIVYYCCPNFLGKNLVLLINKIKENRWISN